MEFSAGYSHVKAGWLAQVWDVNENIIWESKKAYKTMAKAESVAAKKIRSTFINLFADGQS